LVRKATLLTLGAIVMIAGAAMAGVPSPGNSTTPDAIYWVGHNSGTPHSLGTFSVTVRDLANAPINNSAVSVSATGCPDFRIADNQFDAAATVTCASRSVRKFTNVSGVVSFTVLGAGTSNAGGPGCGTSPNPLRGKIIADGVTLKNIIIALPDLDGVNGVGGNDLSQWLAAFGSGQYLMKGDYDFSNGATLGGNDLSVWLGIFGSGGSAQSGTVLCP
jgi:hypothetical protein